jgi:hypothetical protein
MAPTLDRLAADVTQERIVAALEGDGGMVEPRDPVELLEEGRL